MDFKRPVELTVEEPFAAKGDALSEAIDMLKGIEFEAAIGTDMTAAIDIGRAAEQFGRSTLKNIGRFRHFSPKAAKDAVLAMLLSDDDFYEVGDRAEKTIYVPIFQVLCEGGAASRFTTNISYADAAGSMLDLDLTLKGVGLNFDSSSTFSVSFSLPEPIRGAFQLAMPATVETRTYRHRKNDDITGKRSAITSVDAEASIIGMGEAEFVTINDLSYRSPKRFGAMQTLTELSYDIKTDDALEGTLSFPFFKEAGSFQLSAKVSQSSGLKAEFATTEKGVFDQLTGADGPMAHIFDATNLRLPA